MEVEGEEKRDGGPGAFKPGALERVFRPYRCSSVIRVHVVWSDVGFERGSGGCS